MRTFWFVVLCIALPLAVSVVIQPYYPRQQTAEQVVVDLPGVGPGWLDTLRRVAGPAAIDTISPLEFYDQCCDLLGQFERWHMLVSLNAHMPAYARFIRDSDQDGHPLTMANPAGVLAHEFGHRFQFGEWPHVPPVEGDTLPIWARDAREEHYADRFARAMLALRGWDDPDTTDVVLNHRVRYLLLASYWPKE